MFRQHNESRRKPAAELSSHPEMYLRHGFCDESHDSDAQSCYLYESASNVHWENHSRSRPRQYCQRPFGLLPYLFTSQELEKIPEKCPYCVTGAQKGACITPGLTKNRKITKIYFDEKGLLIHIRTHNTDPQNGLTAYAPQHPDRCRQTVADPETGCMEFEIRKGRFSFSDHPIQRGLPQDSKRSGEKTNKRG